MALSNVMSMVHAAYARTVYDGSVQSQRHIERVASLLSEDVTTLQPIQTWPRRWSEAEERFLDQNLGELSLVAIAQALGRTATAVKIRFTRRGMTAPSKRYLTAQDVGRLMGADVHTVTRWIRRGYLKARLMPGERRIWQVRRGELVRFIAEPDHWAYYRLEKIQDPLLRALVQRIQARHPDLADYLTPTEAAEVAGIYVGTLNRLIREGQIPAKRWGNWWILRRDAEAYRQRSTRGLDRWPTSRSDAFLVRAKEEWGWTWAQIARAMKHPTIGQVRYRYYCLCKEREEG